ncbi:MAG: HAMP domain-containing histidine kinase [Oscillospiraceae bacterium]|nr:HAMP domain-containing histidine kinase [Oscillospiraceae bacterium]
MRLKTFFATYLLFLCILFSSVGIVSVYMTSSQVSMLKEKSAGQYQAIAHSLSRDIAVLYGRGMDLVDFSLAVDNLVSGYARYYIRQNVHISIADLTLSGQGNLLSEGEVSFVIQGAEYFIYIAGFLPGRLGYFQLNYSLNVTENIADMQNIQRILLFSAIVFSIVAAFALYFILSSIFKPLSIVAKASRKIANGQFGERINVKGNNELAQVALDFNKMAGKVERQIIFLEEEAVSKQQFVDNFAHEIRTPLTSIYGYAEYLQKASLDEKETIESAGYIMDEANHMRKIANSLLELATLRNYQPVKSPISIPALFEDIGQTMEASLRKHNVRMVCQSDIDTIDGQEDLIRSLLLNLCCNALKACPPAGGNIRLEAKVLPNGTLISVIDDGCGIPKESLPEIAEPFYRVDKSRSREDGGIGLGLTLCNKIAEVHNAEMAVESTVGEGTSVHVTFTTS